MSKIKREKYVPALGFDIFTPLFDPLVRITTREFIVKTQLMKQAEVKSGDKVLDIGCGTGTLALMIKNHCDDAMVCGLDGDQRILKIAAEKTANSGANICLCTGMGFELPFNNYSFDRVVSTLFFHHLTREDKKRTLSEIRRVLRTGGELHIADWGKPQNILMRLASLPLWFDLENRTRDHVSGKLTEVFQSAGFETVEEVSRFMTMFGTISLYKLIM